MKTKFIKVTFVAAIAMVSAINVFNANKTETVSDTVLANVEALAGCEVSSDDTKNTGVCKSDINNIGEYCIASTSIWETGPKCCGTI